MHVPDPEQPVGRRGSNEARVGGDRQPVDRGQGVFVLLQERRSRGIAHVPDAHRADVGADHEQSSGPGDLDRRSRVGVDRCLLGRRGRVARIPHLNLVRREAEGEDGTLRVERDEHRRVTADLGDRSPRTVVGAADDHGGPVGRGSCEKVPRRVERDRPDRTRRHDLVGAGVGRARRGQVPGDENARPRTDGHPAPVGRDGQGGGARETVGHLRRRHRDERLPVDAPQRDLAGRRPGEPRTATGVAGELPDRLAALPCDRGLLLPHPEGAVHATRHDRRTAPPDARELGGVGERTDCAAVGDRDDVGVLVRAGDGQPAAVR